MLHIYILYGYMYAVADPGSRVRWVHLGGSIGWFVENLDLPFEENSFLKKKIKIEPN